MTAAAKHWSDTTPVAGMQFGYEYDPIGNRKTATRGTQTQTYGANTLNQYEQRTVPGSVDVMGTAEAEAGVAVNDVGSTRHGNYWHSLVPAGNNATAPRWLDLSILGMRAQNGLGQEAMAAKQGAVFVPQTPEIFSYDNAGNLTGDGRWTYEWDAENRLTVVQSKSTTPANKFRRYEFGYDWQGRKIWQKLYIQPFGGGSPPPDQTLYIRDGWNIVAELGTATPKATYLWGLDLSGTTSGAGGIGGLLAVRVSGQDTLPLYDGNGNIIGYADAATGALKASLEYSAFGETLLASGNLSSVGTFRFSTKPSVGETGLVDYGFRHLALSEGRWLNRDPLEEDGGLNIYCHVENAPIVAIDPVGRDVWVEKSMNDTANQNNNTMGFEKQRLLITATGYNPGGAEKNNGKIVIPKNLATPKTPYPRLYILLAGACSRIDNPKVMYDIAEVTCNTATGKISWTSAGNGGNWSQDSFPRDPQGREIQGQVFGSFVQAESDTRLHFHAWGSYAWNDDYAMKWAGIPRRVR